jgi:hypothetical protein
MPKLISSHSSETSMTASYRWIVVLLCFQFTGCMVCHDMKRRLFWEPEEFSWPDDRALSLDIYRDLADRAWDEIRRSDPELRCATDFADGFKDGFVDYVYAGGSGDPPPVPPRRYWNVDFRTTGGHEAANRWVEGYRLGVTTAREGGFRDQAVLQSTFRYEPTHDMAMPSYLEMPNAEMPALPMENLGPPTEILENLELPTEIFENLEPPVDPLPLPQSIDDAPRSNSTFEQAPSEAEDKESSLESPFAKYALPWDEKNPPMRGLDSPRKRVARTEMTIQPKKGCSKLRQPHQQAFHTEPAVPFERESTIQVVF